MKQEIHVNYLTCLHIYTIHGIIHEDYFNSVIKLLALLKIRLTN